MAHIADDARKAADSARGPDDAESDDEYTIFEVTPVADVAVAMGGAPPTPADAVEKALEQIRASGADLGSSADVERLRAEATRALEGLDPAGMRDLRSLMLSMGMPAALVTLKHALRASGIRGRDKRVLADRIAALSVEGVTRETGHGCLEINVPGGPVYLLLAECPKNHNLDAQLGRLRPHCSEAQWAAVMQQLSQLVNAARYTYGALAAGNADLITTLAGAKAAEYSKLSVDPANTTLYLDASWPNRVGIYARRGDESLPGEQQADD